MTSRDQGEKSQGIQSDQQQEEEEEGDYIHLWECQSSTTTTMIPCSSSSTTSSSVPKNNSTPPPPPPSSSSSSNLYSYPSTSIIQSSSSQQMNSPQTPSSAAINLNLAPNSILHQPSSSSGFIRASLPNCQRTTVAARRGVSLRDALFKAMETRKLRSEFCLLYRKFPQKIQVDWNNDSSLYSNEDLIVETFAPKMVQTSISHNFIRKTFFSLAFCEVCSKILFHGFRCDVCAFKFHPKCSKNVPSLCQPFRANLSSSQYHHHHDHQSIDHHSSIGANSINQDLSSNNQQQDNDQECEDLNFYSHLLAVNLNHPSSNFGAFKQQKAPNNNQQQQQQLLTNTSSSSNNEGETRERSTSAPNVHHLINQSSNQNEKSAKKKSNQSSSSSYSYYDKSNHFLGSHNLFTNNPPASASASSSSSRNFFSYETSTDQESSSTKSSSVVVKSNLLLSPNSSLKESENNRRIRARSADDSSANQNRIKTSTEHSNTERTGRAKSKLTQKESAGIEDWEIPEEDIIWGERIGSGSFGTVYKGYWHGPVALKRLHVGGGDEGPTANQLQAFKNEVAVLRKTRHVNILLFMGCVHQQLTIVTQWCEGSSLYKHLHVTETKFDQRSLIDVSRQTAQGMHYLQLSIIIMILLFYIYILILLLIYFSAKSIIHRDLKSNNIFLHEDLTVKIGDFGLATVKSRFSQIPAETTTNNSLGANNQENKSAPISSSSSSTIIPSITTSPNDNNLAPIIDTSSSNSNSSSNNSAKNNNNSDNNSIRTSNQSTSNQAGGQPTGSVLWMAPEVIRMVPPSPYSTQSDVYSFGVVLFELTSGLLPYSSLTKDSILFMVGRGLLRPDLDEVDPKTPKPLVRLMMECCSFDPIKRPKFQQILASLESLLSSQPSISRSMSEPKSLNRQTFS